MAQLPRDVVQFVVRLLLVPLVVALVTIAARVWGGRVAGTMMGFPVISGSTSVLLAASHTRRVVATSAVGAVLGSVGAAVFYVAYALATPRRQWTGAVTFSIAALAITVSALRPLSLDVAGASAIAIAVLLAAFTAMLSARGHRSATAPPLGGTRSLGGEIVARAVPATLMVAAVTLSAGWLGATLAGLVSALPVLGAVVLVSSHRRYGDHVIRPIVLGVLAGILANVAFFVTVAVAAPRWPLAATFGCALFNATAVGVVVNVAGPRTSSTSSRRC